MNDKELREIRRRFRPDKNNIMGIRGCFVNDRSEIISDFYQPMVKCSQEESEKLLAIMKKSLSGGLGSNLLNMEFATKQVMEGEEHAPRHGHARVHLLRACAADEIKNIGAEE